jgi:uncharacterized tellurite resistance protein B-like protein
MRHYKTDSTQAAARILALTLLADGGLDQAELDSLAHSRLLRRLGLRREELDRIVREYCEDLQLSADYLDSLRLQPAEEVVRALLDDIHDPQLRLALLEDMQQIIAADGVETPAEVDLLAGALQQWGLAPSVTRHAATQH